MCFLRLRFRGWCPTDSWENWNWHCLESNSYQVAIRKARELTALESEPEECCCLGTHVSPRQGIYECSLEEPWALRHRMSQYGDYLGFWPVEPPGGVWRWTSQCLGAEEGATSDHQNRKIRKTSCRVKGIVGERKTVRKLWRVQENDISGEKGMC